MKEARREKYVLQNSIGTKHKTGQPSGQCVDPRKETQGSFRGAGQVLHLDLSPGYIGVFVL